MMAFKKLLVPLLGLALAFSQPSFAVEKSQLNNPNNVTSTGMFTAGDCAEIQNSGGTGMILEDFGSACSTGSFGVSSFSGDTFLLNNVTSAGAVTATLANHTANSLIGALTATTPSDIAVPSCNGATKALDWTSGTGFSCNSSITAGAVTGQTFPGSGLIVGTTDTQTLTNKSIAASEVNSGTLGLTYGGTGANLSATGGTSQVLQQTTSGGAITVGQLAASNLSNGATGTGSIVLAASPTLTTPALGVPSAITLTNATGLPISTGVSGLGSGVATFLGTPTSLNLLNAVTNPTGTGSLVFGTSPTFVTPALGTPASGVLTNTTGLPLSTGVTGTLQATNFPALTGDITTPGGSLATTLATVNASPGTYTQVTVNGKGLVTSASFTNDKAVLVATTGNLNATYSNGSSGVGATLTNAGTQAAIVIDGITLATGSRVLVWQQSTQAQNGIYSVTTAGNNSTNWVLTRTADFDSSTSGNVFQGATVPVVEGTQYAAYFFIETGLGPFTVGTTAIVFTGNASASGGSVTSVSNTDGTLTISPTSGAVVASQSGITPSGASAGTIDVRNSTYGAIPNAKKLQSCTISNGSASLTCSGASFTNSDTGKSIRIYDIVNNDYVFSGTLLTYGSATTFTLSGNASNACTSTNCLTVYGTDNGAAIQAALNAAQALANSLIISGSQNFPLGAGAPRVVFPIDSRGDGYMFNTTLNTTCCNVVIDADAMLYPNTGFGTADRTWAMNLSSGTHIKKLVMENLGNSGITIGSGTTNSSSTKIDDLQEWTVGSQYSANQPALTSVVVAGGTAGWAVNNTITLTGGTCSQEPVLTVTAVNGSGQVTAATVSTPGACSVPPSNPVSQGSRTGSGTGTTTWTMTFGPNSQTGLNLTGYDFTIKKLWIKNANICLDVNQASDLFIDQIDAIGCATGAKITSMEDGNINNLTCDTDSFLCLTVDGTHNSTIHAKAFSVNSTTLTTGLQIGGYDSSDVNHGLRITYDAQQTGGVGATIANISDSTILMNLTNAALYSESGNSMTKGITYGSGNTGTLDVRMNRDAAITTAFSGSVTGNLEDISAGVNTHYGTGDTFSEITVTGGTINGTAIGGTTPAAVAATTISSTGLAKLAGTQSNGTTFTIASGCGSGGSAPSSLTGGVATGSFVANTTTCSPVITLPTASHGWICNMIDLTHTADTFTQSAQSTTTCTMTESASITSGDTILFHAEVY